MLLRDRIFSLAFLSFLIFSPLSSVIDVNFGGEEAYIYADDAIVDLGPVAENNNLKIIRIIDLAPPSATDLYMTGAMKRNSSLTINYTYVPNPNPEGTTTFQWYTYDDQFGTNKQPIPGATFSTLALNAAQEGKHISVEVTPVDNTATPGPTVEFMPWSALIDNPVLVFNANCVAPTSFAQNFVPVANICSPRDVNWTVSYTGINYRSNLLPLIYTDWGDGIVESFVPTMVNTIPPATFADKVDLVKLAGQKWEISEMHTYDYDGGSAVPIDGTCTYEPVTYFGVGAIVCRTADQTVSLAVWDDLSNTDLGTHETDHDVTSAGIEIGETVEVCAGDDSAVRLIDASTFNCVPTANGGNEDINPNDQSRWVQWVYGTTNNVTTGAAANEKFFVNGVSYDIGDLPIYGTPTQEAGPGITNPAAITDNIQMPVSALPLEVFEITMRSWNTCNPFSVTDDLNPVQGFFDNFQINGSGAVDTEQAGLNGITGGVVFYAHDVPIIRTFDIVIAPQPLPPVAVPKDVCNGSALPNFQITAAGNVAVEWYEDDGLGAIDFGSPITNSINNNSLQLPAADYEPGGPINNTVAGIYNVWARYSSNTGTQNCWSEPVQTSLDVRELLLTPASVSSTAGAPGFTICADGPNITFTVDDGPPGVGIPGGAWEYDWSFGGGSLNDFLNFTTPDGGQSRTVNITDNAASGARRVRVRRRYTSAADNGDCASGRFNFNFNIDPVSIGGSLTSTNTICLGDNTGNIQLTGQTGAITGWEVNINGGGFAADGSLGVANPINPIPAVIGTHEYRAVVKSGVCASIFSATVTVTVNPVPPKPTITPSGPTTFCEDSNVTLSSSNTDANSYQWYKDGAPVGGATFQTIILSTITESGDYTVEVIGIGPTLCMSPISDPTTVLINPLPTATVVGGGSVCSGNPAPDIVWTLTGTQPYSFTITGPGGGFPINEVGYLSNTYTIAGPTVGGNYEMTVLQDGNTCSATVLGGFATVTVVATAPPSIDAFTPGADVCDDGAATTAPVLTLDLAPNSIESYDITFNIYNSAPALIGNQTLSKVTDATGVTTIALNYVADLGQTPDTYEVEITSIVNTGTGCNAAGLPASQFITINPRPVDATNPVDNISCSATAGVPLSVDAPPAGNIIHWYSDVALTIDADPGSGSVGGPQDEVFTPTASLTATFYAVVESTTAPTNCQSAGAIAVTQTEDQQPSPANAETTTAIGVPPVIDGTCDDTFTFNATPADFLGTGTWSTPTAGVTFSNANDPAAVASNIPFGVHTFTWTVTSSLGVCATSTDSYNVERHTLPAANDLTADFCEVLPQGSDSYDVIPADLSSFDDTVTGIVGSVNRTVTYFTDAGLTIPVPNPHPVSDNDQIFARVLRTDVAPQCQSSSTITFNIITLPDAIDQDDVVNPLETEFCEDIVGGGTKTGIDLTILNDDVTNGQANRSVTWYSDALYTIPVAPSENNVSATNGTIFYPRVTEMASGQGCIDDAEVTITVNTRPAANPIIGANTQCISVSTSLYQITPGPAGTTYIWTVPAGFTVFGGGTPVDFFVLLQFPIATTQTLEVTEISPDNCAGVLEQMVITVQPTPPISVITGAAAVCENEAGVAYSVTNTANTTYAWTVPVGASIILGQGTSAVIVNFGVTGGNVQVIPTSSAGCSGGTATLGVTVNPLPILDPNLDNTICSQDDININLVHDGGSPVAAATFDVTANVSPGLVANVGPTTGNGLLSAAIFNDNYTNTTGGPLIVTYTVTPVSADNCAGPAVNVFATINPEPTMAAGLDVSECSDVVIGLNLNTAGGSVVATSYNVTIINVPGALTPGGANAVVQNNVAANYLSLDTYTNIGNIPLVVQYTVVPVSADNCLGSPLLINATIEPEPVIDPTLNTMECSDLPIGVTLATNGVSIGAANYNLVNVGIPGGLTAGGANAGFPTNGVANTFITSDVYTNVTTLPLDVVYEVQGVSAAGCIGDSEFITVTIDPEPVMSAILSTTECSDAASGITFASVGTAVAANDYNVVDVVIPVGATPAGANAVIPANNQVPGYINGDSYTNLTALPIDIIYEVRGVSAAGCVGDSEFITLTVDPEPVVDPALDATVCSDDAIGITFNTNGISVAALSYDLLSINMAAGLVADPGNVILANGIMAGYIVGDIFTNTTNASLTVVYEVRGTAAATGCKGDSEFITATIDPEPVMSPALNTTVCSDAIINVNFTNNGASIPAANYNVVNVTIPAGITAGGGNVAVPANGVIPGYIALDTYTNQTANSLVVIYDVQGVSGAGCVGDSESISVTINPEPVINTGLDAIACSDAIIGLTLNTNGSSVAAANYNIVAVTIPAGLTAGANAVVPANAVGAGYLNGDLYTNQTNSPIIVIYEVEGVSAIACVGDSEFINITIDPEPVIDNTLGGTVCSDAAIALILATDGTSVPAIDYNVVSVTLAAGLVAGGTNVAVPANNVALGYLALDTYTNPTNNPLNVSYDVQGNSAAGCTGDIETITIVIDPEPVISPALDKTVCSDGPINLTLATNGASVAAANYNVKAVTVPAGLTAAGTNAVIPGNGVAGGYIFADSYTNPTAAAINVTYEVTGVSGTGCEGDSEFIIVTIDPEPVINPALDATVCSDDIVGVIMNTNGTSVAAANYNILSVTISAGLVAGGANVAFPFNGVADNYFINDTYENTTAGALTVTYDVRGASAAGCIGDTESIVITINPEPVVDNALDATVCSDQPTNLVLSVDVASTPALDYNIIAVTVPAGLTAGANAAVPANNVISTYLDSDIYTNQTNAALTVIYEVAGVSALGCVGNNEFINITIDPEPVINSGLNTTLCSDDVIGVTLDTDGVSVAAANYNVKAVTVPVGLTAAGTNAAIPGNGVVAGYIFTDSYTNQTAAAINVTYEVTGISGAGCEGDSEFIIITINPEPVIDPALDATVCSDDVVGVTLNTNGTSVAAANYNIIAVTIPAGLTPAGTNVAFPINGVVANYFTNDSYTNQTTGQLIVTYEVRGVSGSGCTGDSEIISVSIDAEPVVSNTLNTTVCSDNAITVNFSTDPSSIGALDYNLLNVTITAGLTPGGGNVGFPANGVAAAYIAGDSFTNTTAGTLTVTYDVQGVSAVGCIGDTRSIIVSIDPEPIVDPALDNNVCSDQLIGLIFATDGASIAAANYNLISVTVGAGLIAGGGNVVPANGINANYVSGDVYTNLTNASILVTYEVTGVSAGGCVGDAEFIDMTIDPEPIMNPGLDNTICSDDITGLMLNDNGAGIAAATFNIIAVTIPAGITPAGGNAAFPANGVATGYLSADTYNNVTAAAIIVIYEVRGVSAAGCVGDSELINFTIDPEPVMNTALNTTICSDDVTNVIFNTNGTSVAAANYDVINVTIPAGLSPAGANAVFPANSVAAGYVANDTYTNQTNGVINVTYEVRGNSAVGCTGENELIIVMINPEPVINTGLDNSVCSDAVTGLVLNTDGISIGASNYNIIGITVDAGLTVDPGNVAIPAVGVASAYLSNDIYTNATNNPLDVVYEVRGVSLSACEGDSEFIVITIEPGPIIDPALDATVCSEDAIGVTFGTAGGSVASISYNVVGITPNPSLIVGGGNVPIAVSVAANYIINDTYTNTTSIPLTVIYEVKGVSAATCVGPSEFITVTIDPEPVIDPGLDKAVCSEDAVGLILNTNGVSVGATTYNVVNVTIPAGLTPDPGNAPFPAIGVVDGYLSNDKYTNLTNASLIVIYEARGESLSTCEGQSRFINITIDPQPVVDPGLNTTVCSDDVVGVTLATNGVSVAAAAYNIIAVTVAGALTASGSNVAIPANGATTGYFTADSYTNTTNTPLDVIYEVQGVSAGGCIGNSEFITVTIDSEPVIDPAITNTVCSDEIIAINLGTAATSVAAATFDVLSVAIPAGLTAGANAAIPGNGVGLGYLSTDTYTNVTASPVIVTYEVRGTSVGGCVGDSESINVTINPEPALNPALDAISCSDEISGIVFSTNGTSVAAPTYNLVSVTPQAGLIPDPGNALPALGVLSTYIQNDQFTNTGNIDLIVQYVVEPVSPQNCVGDQLTILFTIHPEPVLDPGLSPAPVCSDVASGVILNVAAGSVAADYYNIVNITWDPALLPGGANSSIGNNQAANAISGDTFTNTSNVQKLVTYDIIPVSIDNCAGDIAQVIFTINPAPAMSTSLDRVVCINQASGIILATNGVSTPAQNYEVQSVAAAGLVPGGGNVALPVTSIDPLVINGDMYSNPTNNPLTAVYTIVPISAAGCRGPAVDVTLTVEPIITALANNTLPTICSNSSADITLTSPTVPTAGNIAFNLTAVASSPSVSGYIPVLNFLPQGYVIADFLVNTGNTPETVTYTITPVASGAASGNGCTGVSIIEVVTVDPLPLVTPGQFEIVCSNTATNYTITTINNLAGTTFTWLAPTLSDPGLTGGSARAAGSSAPITDTFINTTNIRQTATYNITPTSPAGCVGSIVQLNIFVDPMPTGTISVDQPVICMNGSAILGFTMTVGVAPFEIVYSDGTTDFTVSNIANTHFIAQNGLTATTTYELKSILDVNGCLQNLVGQTVTVTVENPISDFTADITNDCTPLLVTFTNNDIQAGTQYEWNWGDGSPIEIDNSPTITHTFINNSTVSDISYNVILTAQKTNGAVVCTDVSSEFITIKATVNLNITPSTTEGCSPLLVSFINNSQGVLANTWFWREQGTLDQNDLTNISSASFVINNPTTTTKIYEVVYQGDRNGCSDELITEITVHPELVADFSVAPSTVVSITNPIITVTNNTLNKASWNHVWDWGDGQTTNAIDPGTHTYAAFGVYELSLTITDPSGFCTSQKIEIITVEPVLPIVDFEVDFTEGCRPFTVTFTNLSTSVDPATYLWEFRNALGTLVGTSNLENPSFTFFDAGVINVSLSGSNPLGITDTETKLALIEIYDIPTASFTVTPETVFLPDQLLFTSNLSFLADAFEWDFNGDGDTDSQEFEPQHKYESAGVYNISLIAINTATTCRDTLKIDKAVKVVEAGVADIPNGFFPESGGNNPGGPGGSTGGPNSSFLPRLKGVRDDGFEMQIFDRWGHLIFESKDKNVGWNGRDANGKLYPVGVYVYKVDVIYISGQQTTILGDVTLIR